MAVRTVGQEAAAREVHRLAEQGISQREIAGRLGLGKGTVYGILKGQFGLSSERANVVLANAHRGYGAEYVRADGNTERLVPADKRSFSLMGQYWQGVKEYSLTGDDSTLRKLSGKRIKLATPDGPRTMVLKVHKAGIDTHLRAGEEPNYQPINSRPKRNGDNNDEDTDEAA